MWHNFNFLTCNPFVDRQQKQIKSVIVTFVQQFQRVRENGRIFSARRADRNFVAALE